VTDLEYNERLERVISLIRSRPSTAVDIMKALRCAKPAAYGFIAALTARGYRFQIDYVRQSKRGPESARYRLRSETA